MIPLRFFRDKTNVYVNNPSGITKKMTIAEFEAMMSGEGELPAYSSASNGKVLSVNSDGELVWVSLPPSGGLQVVGYAWCTNEEAVQITANTFQEPVTLSATAYYDADYHELDSPPSFRIGLLTWSSINTTCSFDGYYAPDPVAEYDATCIVTNRTQNNINIDAEALNLQFILLG